MTMLAGGRSIREVIAFPKTARATNPLDGAPSPVSAAQLAELGLEIVDSGSTGGENGTDSA